MKPLSSLQRLVLFCIITTLCDLNLGYFYSRLHASQPASALAGIRKIKTVQAAVSVGELRSVPACSAGRRKERRDKAAFRSAHQSGIHTGISQFHRRSQKVMSQKLYVWSWFFLCQGSTTTAGLTAVGLHLTKKEKCHRGQDLLCNPQFVSTVSFSQVAWLVFTQWMSHWSINPPVCCLHLLKTQLRELVWASCSITPTCRHPHTIPNLTPLSQDCLFIYLVSKS